jgi:hypothetical protein
MSSRPDQKKLKRRFGRPPTYATPIMVRLLPEQLAALDAWIKRQPDKPGRPESIRRILGEHLRRLDR